MKENETHQKAYWIVGIALIVFLILLFGSIIGLKITRDGLNNVTDKVGDLDTPGGVAEVPNYEVWDDGTKENISEGVIDAEFNFDGLRISHCSIIERDENFSEISLDVENMTEEKIGKKTLLVKLYDAEDKLMTEFTVEANELEPQAPTHVRAIKMESCVDAKRVAVELINTTPEVVEDVVSGEVAE